MVGLEGVAALELAAQRGMIDDLAVEHDRMAAVGAEDRLVSAGDVDDAEPAHAEAEVAVDQIAGIVGSAMAQAVAVGDDRLSRHGRPPRLYQPAIPHMTRS